MPACNRTPVASYITCSTAPSMRQAWGGAAAGARTGAGQHTAAHGAPSFTTTTSTCLPGRGPAAISRARLGPCATAAHAPPLTIREKTSEIAKNLLSVPSSTPMADVRPMTCATARAARLGTLLPGRPAAVLPGRAAQLHSRVRCSSGPAARHCGCPHASPCAAATHQRGVAGGHPTRPHQAAEVPLALRVVVREHLGHLGDEEAHKAGHQRACTAAQAKPVGTRAWACAPPAGRAVPQRHRHRGPALARRAAAPHRRPGPRIPAGRHSPLRKKPEIPRRVSSWSTPSLAASSSRPRIPGCGLESALGDS